MPSFRVKENWGRENKDFFRQTKIKQKRESKHGLGICREDMELVSRRQNGRSIITGGQIYDFHHEPPIRDLVDAGIKIRGGGVEVVVGVENTVHALLHYAAFKLTNNHNHLNEVTAIMCRYKTEEEMEIAAERFESLVEGPEMAEAMKFVIERRRKYHLPC